MTVSPTVQAQACHAATAALWLSRGTELAAAYTGGAALEQMTKVVLEIKVPDPPPPTLPPPAPRG